MVTRRRPLTRPAVSPVRTRTARPSASAREGHRLYRSIFDNAGVGIALTDPEGHFIQFNRTWLSMMQFERREVLGRRADQITHPEDRDRGREQLAALVSGRIERYRIEKRYIRKDGTVCWVHLVVSALRDVDGRVTSTIALCVDITEQVQAQVALRQQERLMSDLLASTKEGFWFIDNDARTLDVNPAMCGLLGLPRDQILGRSIFEFVDQANTAIFRAEIEARKQGKTGAYEVALLRPDGSLIHCLNNASAMYDENGVKTGSVGLFADITPLKEVQRQLEQATDEAQAANRAKSAFLATMSHELRTPLNGVISVIELLGDHATGPEQRVQIGLARKAADQLLNIIGNVLDMSKLEAGKVTIEAVPFDLDTVVEAASETFAAEAARKDLDFIVDCDPIEYQLVGDPTRLKQILLNLIGNAVKFTAAGRIVVRGTLSRKGQAARLVLVVRDTGIGISESVLPQLMEKFVQASSSTTRDYGGSGLGLAISKQLAHAMGGTLSVSSELGRGSAFTLDVTLPASDRFRTTRPASLLRDVVTVIADQDLRAACARMLAAEGHHHHAADDVNGALSLLRQSAKARTVLLDEAACAGHLQRDLDKLRSSGLPIEQTIVLAGLRFESSALTDPSRDVPDVLAKPLTRSKLKGVLSTGRAPHKRAVAEGSNGSLRSSVPTAPRAVLVVEDNLTNQYVVRKTLELLGFTVSLAGDGLEAVAMAGQQAFDLVLMDLQMPRLDGIGAARRIRAQEGPNRETPIIAITANAFTDDVRRCLDAGMNGHLSKPLRRRELAEMIETVLGGVDTSHAAGGA